MDPQNNKDAQYHQNVGLRVEHTDNKKNKPFSFWLKKNHYYHQQLLNFFTFVVPRGSRVLQVGCKNGYILNALMPSLGVGIEDDVHIFHEACQTYQHLQFYMQIEALPTDLVFDYIILTSITLEIDDIQNLFEKLQRFCHPRTRIIVDSYSYMWEPMLALAQKLGLRRATRFKNWISRKDLQNFLHLADFDCITTGRHTLLPLYIPLISVVCNKIMSLIPGLNRLCLHEWIIARPLPHVQAEKDYMVSVVIPCRNERGNIEAAVVRTPAMARRVEFIFVEGHSQDGTLDEIRRIAALYPEKDISILVQDGKGKGDAMRKGFAHAQGDILMILDADLTVPPEELPKFLDALLRGKGELINGSRMIYGMEQKAMRFLNLLANHGFSLLFTWLLGQRVKDTLCGTKVLFKKDYQAIVENRSYFGDFDPYGDFDLLFGAAKLNLKIVDMPVHYKSRVYGTSQISRFHGGFLLLMMSLVAFKKFKMHT